MCVVLILLVGIFEEPGNSCNGWPQIMLRFIFSKQYNGSPGNPTRNANLGFIQKSAIVPIRKFLGQSRVFSCKILSRKCDGLDIEIVCRGMITYSSRPILCFLPSDTFNFLKTQWPKGIMDAPESNALPCRRYSAQSRRNLEHDDTAAFDIQLVDMAKGILVIGMI